MRLAYLSKKTARLLQLARPYGLEQVMDEALA